jgi:hypothetical protein
MSRPEFCSERSAQCSTGRVSLKIFTGAEIQTQSVGAHVFTKHAHVEFKYLIGLDIYLLHTQTNFCYSNGTTN